MKVTEKKKSIINRTVKIDQKCLINCFIEGINVPISFYMLFGISNDDQDRFLFK